MHEAPDSDEALVQEALGVALARLRSRERSESEIRIVLADRGFVSQTIEATIQHLKGKGILNDERLANHILATLQGKKAVGNDRLRAELKKRGLADDLIERASLEQDRDSDNLIELLNLKYPRREWAERGRAGRFLVSRGFDETEVGEALASYFGAPDSFAE